MVVAAVVSALLPNEWQNWLRCWRGVPAAGFFLALATVTIAFAVAILVADDHFGAATPKYAYITGAFLIVLGLAIVGFAVAAYRNNPSGDGWPFEPDGLIRTSAVLRFHSPRQMRSSAFCAFPRR